MGMMRIAGVGLLAAVLAACGSRPNAGAGVAHVRPELPPVIADAFRRMNGEFPEETRDSLRATPPGEMVRWHMSLGTYVRNEYGLWRGGPLQDWFLARGARHPDDMSHVLLEAYGGYLRGERPDVDSLIAAMPAPPRESPPPG